MDNPKENSIDEITLQKIYDEVKSQGCIERIYEDMATKIQNESSFKSMMEVAEQNIFSNTFSKPIKGVQMKVKKIQEIGFLAAQYDSSIANIIAETIENEAIPVVEGIIKQLLHSKINNTAKIPSSSKKGIKRSANKDSEKADVSKNFKDSFEAYRDRFDDSDTELNASESVSSVHTSELSSFEDEIVLPTEKKNGKKEKILSFKAVNQAYKSMMSQKKKTPVRRQRTQKTSQKPIFSNESSESDETVSRKTLPKRERKPNSRYSKDD